MSIGKYRYPLCLRLFKNNDEEYNKLLISFYKKYIHNKYDEEKIRAFLLIASMNEKKINIDDINENIFKNTPDWSCEILQSSKPFMLDTYCSVCDLNDNNVNKYKVQEEEVLSYILNHPESYYSLINMEFKSKVIYYPDDANDKIILVPVLQKIFLSFLSYMNNTNVIDKELFEQELKSIQYNDCLDSKIFIDYYNTLLELKVDKDKFKENLKILGISAERQINTKNTDSDSGQALSLPINILNEPCDDDNNMNGKFIYDFICKQGDIRSSIVTDYIEINTNDTSKLNDNKTTTNSVANNISTNNVTNIDFDSDMAADNIIPISTKDEFERVKPKLIAASIIYIGYKDNSINIFIKTKKVYTFYKLIKPYEFKDELTWLLSSLITPKIINSIKPIYELIYPNITLISNLHNLYVGEKVLSTSFKAIEVFERFKSDEVDKFSNMTFSKIINTYEKQMRLIKKASLQNYYEYSIGAYNAIIYSCSIKPFKYTIKGFIENSISDAIYPDMLSECGSWSPLITNVLVSILNSKINNYTDIHIYNITTNGFEIGCKEEYLLLLSEIVNLTFIRMFKHMVNSKSTPRISIKKNTS